MIKYMHTYDLADVNIIMKRLDVKWGGEVGGGGLRWRGGEREAAIL